MNVAATYKTTGVKTTGRFDSRHFFRLFEGICRDGRMRDLKPTELKVLFAILSHRWNPTGIATVSRDTIAENMGHPGQGRWVGKIINSLVAKGYLALVERGGGRHRENQWSVRLPETRNNLQRVSEPAATEKGGTICNAERARPEKRTRKTSRKNRVGTDAAPIVSDGAAPVLPARSVGEAHRVERVSRSAAPPADGADGAAPPAPLGEQGSADRDAGAINDTAQAPPLERLGPMRVGKTEADHRIAALRYLDRLSDRDVWMLYEGVCDTEGGVPYRDDGDMDYREMRAELASAPGWYDPDGDTLRAGCATSLETLILYWAREAA